MSANGRVGPPKPGVKRAPLITTDVALAAKVVAEGGLILFPTDTLPGLGCDPSNAEALRRLAALKRRPPGQPFPLLLPDAMPLEAITPAAALVRTLVRSLWPGSLTLVLPARSGLPRGWVSDDGTIGVRRSAHPVARALLTALGHPLVATSANRSGEPAPVRMATLSPELRDAVDVVLEGGADPLGVPSSIVRVQRDGGWSMLRAGETREETVRSLLGKP